MQLRGGQNEHEVLRRLLQNLQQRVEGRSGEHVHLIHNIHPLAHCRRGVYRLVPQGAHLVHAVIGGGVQLQHIQDGAALNAQAGRTLVAGIAVHRVFTVHRPGQDLGAGGLSRSPGAGKQVGVAQPAGGHLALERVGDMGLAHHIVKGAGPPFAVQGLIQGRSPQIKSKRRGAEDAESRVASPLSRRVRRVARPHTGLWRLRYTRYPGSRLRSGTPAAQVAVRLVLLGSPPDTVHGAALRGTDPSSLLTWGRQHNAVPGAGIHPCCSGLQVQGTANSPTSAALPRAGRLCAVRRKAVFDIIHHFPPFINITFHFFQKRSLQPDKLCYNI